jgi:hypothetical protein
VRAQLWSAPPARRDAAELAARGAPRHRAPLPPPPWLRRLPRRGWPMSAAFL